jgi:hypothetical protein
MTTACGALRSCTQWRNQMDKKDGMKGFERDALASLQAVALDTACSATARVAAAKAILEHLRPSPQIRAKGDRKAGAAPSKTPAELASELDALRKRRAIDALR